MADIPLPSPGGRVYLDAQCVIYTVEQRPVYSPLLAPLWAAVQIGQLTTVTSELTIAESLVVPIRLGDTRRLQAFEAVFGSGELGLLPISPTVLRDTARLRAVVSKLRTPDAIHAATALAAGVDLFVTNDTDFRRVPGLPVVVLDDLLAGS